MDGGSDETSTVSCTDRALTGGEERPIGPSCSGTGRDQCSVCPFILGDHFECENGDETTIRDEVETRVRRLIDRRAVTREVKDGAEESRGVRSAQLCSCLLAGVVACLGNLTSGLAVVSASCRYTAHSSRPAHNHLLSLLRRQLQCPLSSPRSPPHAHSNIRQIRSSLAVLARASTTRACH